MRRRGFMLIELAVASFVIGVAVLALVAVLHVGQRAATDSDGATRAALFADDVFTTLRLMNDRAAADPDPEVWAELWEGLYEGSVITQLAGFASEVWEEDSAGDLPRLDTSRGVHTNFWCPARLRRGVGDAVELVRADFALRYAVSIAKGDPVAVGDRAEPIYYSVTLHVWPGTSTASDTGTDFFSVFCNPGRMR